MNEIKQLSVIVPAYNEEKAIKAALADLIKVLSNRIDFEIIVINDGSTDRTLEEIKDFSGIKIINHPYNKGYGASIKTGLKNSAYDWVLLFDADGQHRALVIPELLNFAENFDMIVAARVKGYKGPMVRQPGRRLLHWIANYLSGRKIPDLNSGFRLFKKNYALKFANIYPNGFSISTTMTLAFFKDGLSVKYVPYQVLPRLGKSTVGVQDGFKAIMLILRMIMLFSPLKVFLPMSCLVFILALLSFVHDLLITNLTDTTTLLFITSLLLFSFGLLADQLAHIRREIK